jgi:nitrite reductase (NADH) large subunit
VRFKPTAEIPADLVVMAIGIRPNTALAEAAGLHCNRGIVVNDTMQTYDPRIYAVGECVAHRGIAYGLVAPLFEQAKGLPTTSPSSASPATAARSPPPSSRSPASTSSPPAISSAARHRRDRAGRPKRGGVYKKLVLKRRPARRRRALRRHGRRPWYFQLMKDEAVTSARSATT